MAGESYLNIKNFDEIQQALQQVPNRAERAINNVLQTVGINATIKAIVGFIPVSDRKKRHAKTTNPLKGDMMNLGFRVYARGGAAKNKNSFGYLIFPNDGIGPHNPSAKQFFERGTQVASNKIFTNIMAALSEAAQL